MPSGFRVDRLDQLIERGFIGRPEVDDDPKSRAVGAVLERRWEPVVDVAATVPGTRSG